MSVINLKEVFGRLCNEKQLTLIGLGQMLGFKNKDGSVRSVMNQIQNIRRPIPKGRIKEFSEVLGISEADIINHNESLIALKREPADILVSVEQLEYLAGIVKAAGKPLPVRLLLEHLKV